MTFWSGEKLLDHPGVISDFDVGRLDGNSYNLRMGNSYFRTTVDDAEEPRHTEMLGKREFFVVPPGQFAFLLTKESVTVPNDAMAFISMRTKVKFRGLINVSGFHVDPGYSGKLVFAVFNAGPLPIQLQEDERLFKIWFADLDRASDHVYDGAPVNEISSDMVNQMNRAIYSLQTLAAKMRDIESKVDVKLAEHATKVARQEPMVENLNFIWRAVIVGVIAFILISIFTIASPLIGHMANVLFQTWAPNAVP